MHVFDRSREGAPRGLSARRGVVAAALGVSLGVVGLPLTGTAASADVTVSFDSGNREAQGLAKGHAKAEAKADRKAAKKAEKAGAGSNGRGRGVTEDDDAPVRREISDDDAQRSSDDADSTEAVHDDDADGSRSDDSDNDDSDRDDSDEQEASPTTRTGTLTGEALALQPTSPLSPGAAVLALDKLSWAPPVLSNPVTYRVSGDGPGTLRAARGQDSIVVFDGPVHRRIRMEGGRHWIVRGGEVLNDKQWSDIDDQSGLEFAGVTGTAFVEGVLIHGRYGKDGIRVADGGSDTTLVVQNSRIVDRMSGPTRYHADVIQPFGGVEALLVDRLTGMGDYQGQMWKQESGTTFGPSDFRRVNYRASTPQVQYMINFVMSSPTQPVTLTEVYTESDPAFVGGDFCQAHTPSGAARCATGADGRKYVTWSGTPITVSGRVTQGGPVSGDFVPEGVAGLGYVSPGYL